MNGPPLCQETAGEAIRPEDHVGLARWLARRHGATAPDPEAVLSIALEELVLAARRYDPARGKWAAYAGACIRARVRGSVLRQCQRQGRHVPLTRIGLDGQEYERTDLPTVAPDAERAVLAADIRRMLAALPPREASVLSLRFGMEGPASTRDQVGEVLGLPRWTISRLEARALERLRIRMSSRSGLARWKGAPTA